MPWQAHSPREVALRALLQDETSPWAMLRRAYLLIRDVLLSVDRDSILQREYARRRLRVEQGLAPPSVLSESVDLQDVLQECGSAMFATTDTAIVSLKTLQTELRTLEHEYGLFGPSPATTDTGYMCYPMPVAFREADPGVLAAKEALLAALSAARLLQRWRGTKSGCWCWTPVRAPCD